MNATTMLPQKPTFPLTPKKVLSRKPPMMAPATPTTMSAMQPNPRPATTRAAIAPAIKPTNIHAIQDPGSRLRLDASRPAAIISEAIGQSSRTPRHCLREHSGQARLPFRDPDLEFQGRAGDNESPRIGQVARTHCAQHDRATK